MMFYDMSRQYHAERPRTAAEQRRADMRLGMMAAEISGAWQRAAAPARALRGRFTRRPGRRCMPGETIGG